MTGNTHVAYPDINPAEFHLANPGNCLNNRGHLLRREAVVLFRKIERDLGLLRRVERALRSQHIEIADAAVAKQRIGVAARPR